MEADAPPPTSSDVVLEVDADGIFVSREPVSGEWFAGYGVQCVLPPLGKTDGKRLVGRLAGEQPVLIFRRKGTLDSLTPSLRQVEGSHVDALRAAAAEAALLGLEGEVAGEFAQAVRGAFADPAPPVPDPLPPRAQPAMRRDAPLPDGTPLMAWAPEGMLVVRFRSVEAAFRFCDLAGRLSARLLLDEQDARDHGTLRLTLHHLLLPSIWKANPGGRKGVRECALIVPGPLRRGPLRAAAILRVVDDELHDQETRAGVALEARPDHLWRPEGDPFPEERVRTAVRARAGDVEVVATDAVLLEQILAGPGRPADEWTQEAVAARHGLTAPDRKRAFTLAGVPEIGWALHDATHRAREGARRLAMRWLGLDAPPASEYGRQTIGIPVWARAVAVTADTDAEGAHVAVRLENARAATALRERLTNPHVAQVLSARACRENLLALVPLGIVEPRCSDPAERAFVWLGWRPACPEGGAYRLHPGTGQPSCSTHGTAAEAQFAFGAPSPPPWSDVRDEGITVTFRLSIDW